VGIAGSFNGAGRFEHAETVVVTVDADEGVFTEKVNFTVKGIFATLVPLGEGIKSAGDSAS
jgi:hypothetical protein